MKTNKQIVNCLRGIKNKVESRTINVVAYIESNNTDIYEATSIKGVVLQQTDRNYGSPRVNPMCHFLTQGSVENVIDDIQRFINMLEE